MKNRSRPRRRSPPLPNTLRMDPSRTGGLRRAIVAQLRNRFDKLKVGILKLVDDEDAFGLRIIHTPIMNARFKGPDPEKLKDFQEWLKTQVEDTLSGQNEEGLWDLYARQGYQKGQGRAYEDVKGKRKRSSPSNKVEEIAYEGGRQEFLGSSFANPVGKERIKVLAGRSFNEIQGLSAEMQTRLVRILADGLTQGKSPKALARDLVKGLDISKKRAEVIARSEIVRAHAEGQLDALESMGIERVGAAVEWSTTGDSKVCKLCQPIEGIILTVAEARGMIPRHPCCRCAWLPFVDGTPTEGKKVSKYKIDKAIKTSQTLGTPKKPTSKIPEEWGPGKSISRKRPVTPTENIAINPDLAQFSQWVINEEPLTFGILPIPDYRQEGNYDCGVAVTQSVSDYYHLPFIQRGDLIAELGTSRTQGTEAEAIANYFINRGHSVLAHVRMRLEDLPAYVNQGEPVIVPIQLHGDNYDPLSSNRAGHYVIVKGYTGGTVHIQDPISGYIMLDGKEFDRRWHDVGKDGFVDDHLGIIVRRKDS